LAGFYWRLKGNTFQAIECYRRAAHFAPLLYKDVAYIALANVMLDIEALEEAAIFARAAVDIRPHEVQIFLQYVVFEYCDQPVLRVIIQTISNCWILH